MLKKAAALLLVCASMGAWLGCGTTSSRYLYAAIPQSNEIVAFREDPNAGVLTQLVGSPITAGQGVQALAIHPSKKFLYAANSGATPFGSVSLFTISSAGSLTEVTPRQNVGTAPTLMVIDSAGAYLYVANSGSADISVFSINASNGMLTAVAQAGGATAGIGVSAFNMKLSPSGNMLYVTGQGSQGFIEEFPVNKGVLGAPVPGSPFPTGNDPYGLAIDSSGSHLYTANKLDSSISAFTIGSDGSLTLISTTGETSATAAPVSVFIDNSGKYLYAANQGTGNLGAYSIGSDGGLTLLTNSPFGTGSQPSVVTGDSSGKYLFVGNQSSSAAIQSFSLDTGSGTLTSVASYSVPGTPTSIAITP